MRDAGQHRILYAEDDPAHAELLRRALRKIPLPIALDHVSDGEQALDYLYRRGDYEHLTSTPLPNLILLDRNMPNIDGVRVCRFIKLDQLLNHIPVVILSATYTDFVEQQDSLDANNCLVKPTDPGELRAMVESLCQRYLQRLGIRSAPAISKAGNDH